jgi:hypothetical protein
MLIKEFRIVLPMTVEEYQVAQLWSVAKASKENTGGGEGIEVLKNEPFTGKKDLFKDHTDGQYTHKIYKLQSKVPWWIRKLAPKGTLEMTEKAWNAYPFCKTVLSNPDYMKDNFFIDITSFHKGDNGTTENVFELSKEQLAKREVVRIDIANDSIAANDYTVEEDPAKFLSEKTGRGKLGKDWINSAQPVMTCYKLVTVEFKWFGLQNRVEKFIQSSEKRLFTKFHRQIFCWIDQWYGLTMADIRKIEDDVQKELQQEINKGEIKGYGGLEE